MTRALRIPAIAILVLAMLNAAPGLCFCRQHGAAGPAGDAGSAGCCHRGTLAFHAVDVSCCQIDKAEHAAAQPDTIAVALPAPEATVLPPHAAAAGAPVQPLTAAALSPSPPVLPLRI